MGLLDEAIREHLELKRRRGADAGDISREESEALGPVRRDPDGAPDPSDTFAPEQSAGEAPEARPPDSDETSVLGTVAGAHEPPSPAPPAYEQSAYEPPPAPAYEPPSPPAHEPPAAARPWSRAERTHVEPGHESLASETEPEPEPEPEHSSLLSRFRVGRRKHDPPPAADEPSPGYDPPPLPAADHERASGHEPPPAPPPSPYHGYDPPTEHHEPDIVPADDEGDVEDVLEETPDFLEETPEHDRLWFEQRPPRDFDFDD